MLPTHRRPRLLARCLAALAAQTAGSRAEVICVDDGSADHGATARVLAAHPRVRALTQAANRGPAAARNRALGAAKAPLVLFLDDDVVAPPDLVERHLAVHAAHAAAGGEDGGDATLGVLGRVAWHPALRVTPFMRWLDGSGLQFGYDTWLRAGPVFPPYTAFYTANLSMPLALLERVGGFDERFPHPAWEDMELAWRLTAAGFRLAYHPEVVGWHARAITPTTFRRRMSMVGMSGAVLARVQPQFPLGSPDLEGNLVGRRELVRRAARAAVTRSDADRSAWWWGSVARAHDRGRRTSSG